MSRRTLMKTGLAAGVVGQLGPTEVLGASDNLWVPPEEDPHELTFMQWPNSRLVYDNRAFLEVVQETIADIANAIADFEPGALLASKEHHNTIRPMMAGNVELWDIPTEDLWCRDSGPLIAKRDNSARVVSHLQFNGWGEKQVHTHDGEIARRIAKTLGIDLVPSGLKGEGGGVDHDGHGHLIAHESSWVIDNRNPGFTRNDIEEMLKSAYGVDTVTWSPGARGWDITDYHIDSLARFTGPKRVLINLPDQVDHGDPFHRAALRTHEALIDAGYDVEVIPEPNRRRVSSLEFVASYANYYACNGAIIAAAFGDRETDDIAREALARHYPGREIVTLNVDVLGEIGGGIHCATQQLPAA